MGVDMRWIRTSTAIKAQIMGSLPIKGELIIDPTDSKVVIKYDPPTHTQHLITAKVEPVNFVVYVPKSVEHLPCQFELTTLYSHENVRNIVLEVRQPALFLLD